MITEQDKDLLTCALGFLACVVAAIAMYVMAVS